MFVCVLAMVALTLAAIVHDRQLMEEKLNSLNENLETQVHNVTLPMHLENWHVLLHVDRYQGPY
jgi:hypothetical protein